MAGKQIENVDDLINCMDLVGLRYYKFSGSRLEPPNVEATPGQYTAEIAALVRFDERHIEVRLVTSAKSADAELAVDIAGTFESVEPLEIPEPLRREFVEQVGFVHLYPYVKQALADAATRLQVPAPNLGFLPPSGLKLTPEDE